MIDAPLSAVSFAPLAVALPIFGAALAFIMRRKRRTQITVTISVLVITLCLEIWMLATVWGGGTYAVTLGGWAPPFGISMVVDGFSAFMLVVSSVVCLAVLLYATSQGMADGDEDGPVSIFHPAYLILVAGVSNAFLAGDLFNLYVGFEILLTASYVLLTLGGTVARIRAGTTYVVVSVLSSMLFLISIGMIYAATGTVNMADLSLKLAEIAPGTQTVLHVMLLVAFGIKAAVFPLSFWLPDSYPTAPAPVTAVFAGLLTKVGVYAIIRTETLLFPGNKFSTALLVVAGLTMLVGILGAVAQTDIKRMLSFTLTSHIGFLIFGVAVGNQLAMGATVYYVAHHIVVQTSLFLVAGLIERRAGTSNIDRLGSLAKLSPLLGMLFFIPAINLGGIPPFSGFLGKLGLVQGGAEMGTPLAWVLIAVSLLTSLLTLLTIARIWNRAFWRKAEDAVDPDPLLLVGVGAKRGATYDIVADEPGSKYSDRGDSALLPKGMLAMTGALVLVGVALTVFAGPLFDFSDRAAEQLLNPGHYIEAVLGSTEGNSP
ncbi:MULTISPECIES: Na+/H+ antiporter subunit D [Paeniglutamicibacter]|uniref:Na+/H+ antiporter subunit D n=1 Tax=Paeniglutamicibacter terrestris TaxID=2723403 RepID=A0ABX1FZ89_9MICC|nr:MULTISPECIES: Na+/H+ antiporter subunit D [Paeniglutamicibacter]ASN38487.1 Na+/H+ antiporter subunit D [Arthrobacter sp. 7749]NKG19263.1 Na+/H+ antiporter subunit D [Paeniglutamicibacter terrestris]QXQ09501.1 Na+/H+ antiporter subunit D [Paeniglutamicibacter sp. Y32M11]